MNKSERMSQAISNIPHNKLGLRSFAGSQDFFCQSNGEICQGVGGRNITLS